MRLEDALLQVVLDVDAFPDQEAAAWCESVIAGGADIVRVRPRELARSALEAMRDICRREDALLVMENDAACAAGLGADGVHLSGPSESVGEARATAGDKCILGISSTTLDEARLALELGVDYLVHEAGAESGIAAAALRGIACVPIFAGRIRALADARAVTGSGLLRLAVDASAMGRENVTAQVAEFARIMGRCI